MKYLLIFFIITVLVFQWRSSRAEAQSKSKTKPTSKSTADSAPQTMVACSECGLHISAADALTGSRGTYCSAAHRQLREP